MKLESVVFVELMMTHSDYVNFAVHPNTHIITLKISLVCHNLFVCILVRSLTMLWMVDHDTQLAMEERQKLAIDICHDQYVTKDNI